MGTNLPKLSASLDADDRKHERFSQSAVLRSQALYQAQLATEEIGTNIIKYGYDDQLKHSITLRVECLADCFRLRILDGGHPFDARQVPEPDPEQSLQARKPGGWGRRLVRRLARGM